VFLGFVDSLERTAAGPLRHPSVSSKRNGPRRGDRGKTRLNRSPRLVHALSPCGRNQGRKGFLDLICGHEPKNPQTHQDHEYPSKGRHGSYRDTQTIMPTRRSRHRGHEIAPWRPAKHASRDVGWTIAEEGHEGQGFPPREEARESSQVQGPSSQPPSQVQGPSSQPPSQPPSRILLAVAWVGARWSRRTKTSTGGHRRSAQSPSKNKWRRAALRRGVRCRTTQEQAPAPRVQATSETSTARRSETVACRQKRVPGSPTTRVRVFHERIRTVWAWATQTTHVPMKDPEERNPCTNTRPGTPSLSLSPQEERREGGTRCLFFFVTALHVASCPQFRARVV
jgi:hypothetical protein